MKKTPRFADKVARTNAPVLILWIPGRAKTLLQNISIKKVGAKENLLSASIFRACTRS